MNRLTAFMPMSDLEEKRAFSFPDIRCWKVLNTTGHEVGRVEEVFVDPNTLEPVMVLLDYPKFLNFNTKRLLVPWNEIQILQEGQVRTRPTEEQLADAPEWQEGTSDWARITDYWVRRACGGSRVSSAAAEDLATRR